MKPEALHLMDSYAYESVYGAAERADLDGRLAFVAPPQTKETYASLGKKLEGVEVIVAGWGMPKMDAAFLARFPNLKIVFYGAGSVRGFVTDESWARGVRVTSAPDANAVPVAEFTFAQIILSLKQVWGLTQDMRAVRGKNFKRRPVAGAYRSVVGVLSLGKIGRLVVERLRTLNVEIIAYDPFIEPQAASWLGVKLASLDEIFATADVVSCHTPWLPSTERMLRRSHFEKMKTGATFINTARGAVVAEDELISVLAERPDVFALLDVTYPEPPTPDSLLFTLPNVVLTPHIAGSVGRECERMGRMMVNEVDLYLTGQPLQCELDREAAERMA